MRSFGQSPDMANVVMAFKLGWQAAPRE